MKKRIITVTLAFVLAFNILAVRPRAAGAGVAAAGIALGVLAFNLIGVMSGEYDDVAEGMGCLIENGVEGWQKAFVGTETTPSWFASGWQQIYDTCSSWFDSGDITLTEDGKVDISYSQYLELCDLLAGTSTDLDIDLGSSVDYKCFEWDFSQPVPLVMAPKYDSFYTDVGNSYVPIYYSKDKIYICLDYFRILFKANSSNTYDLFPRSCYIYNGAGLDNGTAAIWGFQSLSHLGTGNFCFQYYNGSLDFFYNGSRNAHYNCYRNSWLSWDGTASSVVSTSNLDTSGMISGYMSLPGHPDALIKSLTDFKATPTLDVDDLSDVLPLDKTKNPTLEVDTDPAITNPNDAVTIKDVPGQADLTLSELKANTRLDLDIPSMIATKFPFCIPFDLIRIMSVLGADPVAPVFRIPISTDMKNLEPFAGNQTIGEVPENFEPMFEIDEEIVLDLSAVPLIQPICYTVFIISFIVLLIYITPKMINH